MPMRREELLSYLASLGIETNTREHPPVFTVEEARALRGTIPGGHCKNLFLSDKNKDLWLIVSLEDAVIDLKSLPVKIGSGRISFGRAEVLHEVLGIDPGSVTPFALINDREARVNVVLDEVMMREPKLNYHPLENTATTTIASQDLLRFIRSCGHSPRILPISEVDAAV